jgi:glycosyltransferase involved in cell wall biosynthesis
MLKDKAFSNTHTIKVLMIGFSSQIHSMRPLNWLLERGCRVVFSNGVNPFPDGKEGFSFVRFPKSRGGRVLPKLLGNRVGSALYEVLAWVPIMRLKMQWKRIRPSIVHVHWVDDRAYFCVKAGLRPLVLTVWGSDINILFLPDANPAARRRVGKALAGADLVLIDSADLHKKCSEIAGRDVSTKLFSLGINTARFRPGYQQEALEWRQRLDIPTGAIVLLSIRAWLPLYRHESILKAFARALPQLNSKAVLVFKFLHRPIVNPNLYENELRDLAEKLGVSQMVRWMDEVPLHKVPEVYSFADVILNYPSMDAFPVTFLEAAACERPVISCQLPAYAGTFAEDYFRMVSPNDPAELSDAIVEFVNQGRAGSLKPLSELRQLVCQQYDEKIVADRLLDIYSRLSSPS